MCVERVCVGLFNLVMPGKEESSEQQYRTKVQKLLVWSRGQL